MTPYFDDPLLLGKTAKSGRKSKNAPLPVDDVAVQAGAWLVVVGDSAEATATPASKKRREFGLKNILKVVGSDVEVDETRVRRRKRDAPEVAPNRSEEMFQS